MSYMPKIPLDPTDLLHIEYVVRAYLETFDQDHLVEIAREEDLPNGVGTLAHALNKLAANNGHSQLVNDYEYEALLNLEEEHRRRPLPFGDPEARARAWGNRGEVTPGIKLSPVPGEGLYCLTVDLDDGTFCENPDPDARKTRITFRPTLGPAGWRYAYGLARSILNRNPEVAPALGVATVEGLTLQT